MKKTLVYHLYVGNDIETNMCYKVHSECLKYFIYLFDKVKFTISVDDLSNTDLVKKGVEWILGLGFNCEMEITTSTNSFYRESITFYNKVLKSDDDELFFFFHSKGTTNFIDSEKSRDSVFLWICGIYFYSLNSDYKCTEMLENTNRTMCGPFLISPTTNEKGKFSQLYAGAGYWVNNASLRNLRKINAIPELSLSDRYFAENYPGMVLSTDKEYGLESVDNIMMTFNKVDGTLFYQGTKGEWDYVINIYPYPEKFIEFINYIGNKVGYIPFNE